MKRIKLWLSRLFIRACLRAWRNLRGPGAVELHAQVIVRRDEKGRVTYQLLDGLGDPASDVVVSSLFVALADLGDALPRLDPTVKRDCRRLGARLRELQLLATARIETQEARRDAAPA